MWNLAASLASWREEPLNFDVDLQRPERGLLSPRLGAASFDPHLLRIHTPGRDEEQPETIIDAYARGRDLIAVYAQTPQRTVRPSVYWSPLAAGMGVELVLSMQTSLLESAPLTTVCSQFSPLDDRTKVINLAGQKAEVAADTFLLRPLNEQFLYAEMVHPSDFAGLEIAKTQGEVWRRTFFPDSLEKGVIRRCRMVGLFAPTTTAPGRIGEQLTAWMESPPPLTT